MKILALFVGVRSRKVSWSGDAPETKGMLVEGSGLLDALIIIFQAHDVVLAEVVAQLNFYNS